ncbi:MAG: prepilin peptidase [Planctomycetes bacterium]|nr:prepilin peptidase [Planctomycetota bacterium]
MSDAGAISVRAGARTIESARLWPSLASPWKRIAPAQGFDVLGERVSAWRALRAARALPWGRAHAIVKAAAGFRNHSEGALDDVIQGVREAVMLSRDEEATVDAAFAAAYEVIRREIGLSLHVEQVLGALALAAGRCAELATGEGKTVTAILPAAIEGWTGKGVHVVTVNDYLARRDAQTTAPAFRRLGISVGVIQDSTTHEARQRAYAADITYAADKQVIFDHLRDRLASPLEPRLTGLLLDGLAPAKGTREQDPNWHTKVVHRGLNFAIIDEADSVLIDEAVTPAIIAQHGEADEGAAKHYLMAAELARQMAQGEHYIADERLRHVKLTEAGRDKLTEAARTLPPFWAGPRRREELMIRALTAKDLHQRGRDYIVNEEGKVVIVDRSTGRVLPGRQWQLGLHQAVEAKEGVEVSAETHVTARTSYQGFFQRYKRLSGMTGTAREVAPELWRWYRLACVPIPTHKPVIREVSPDRVFDTQEQKLQAAADRAAEAHRGGRPVLVGTWSVITSERMGRLLKDRGVPAQILNATREAEEAQIIERAGHHGAVTVATNMAGRGTDIRLTPESRAAGGLLVIATERHDEARVDRQLAGRAGRQGDPGGVEVFVSLEDQLIHEAGPRVLRALAQRTRGAARRLICRALWAIAQHNAGRKWSVVRAETAKADAWLEMAIHSRSR